MVLKGVVVVLILLLKNCCSFDLLAGIFDPNPFIPKIHPDVLAITKNVEHSYSKVPTVTTDAEHDHEQSEQSSNDETGETNEGPDTNDFEYKSSEDSADSDGDWKPVNGEGLGISYRTYRVTEDLRDDVKDPNKQRVFGAPANNVKQLPQTLPVPGSWYSYPAKSTVKENEYGYESVIYHHGEYEQAASSNSLQTNGHAAPQQPVFVYLSNVETKNSQEDRQEYYYQYLSDDAGNRDLEQHNYNTLSFGNDRVSSGW